MDTGQNKITTANELRAILLGSIEAVLEGRINVAQANSVIGLSTEVHKSLKQEWEMRCYAADNFRMSDGNVIKLLDGGND